MRSTHIFQISRPLQNVFAHLRPSGGAGQKRHSKLDFAQLRAPGAVAVERLGKNNFVRTFVGIGSNMGDRAAYLLLGVRGMMANHRLAGAISDAAFYEFRRQVSYKCEWRGVELVVAPRSSVTVRK